MMFQHILQALFGILCVGFIFFLFKIIAARKREIKETTQYEKAEEEAAKRTEKLRYLHNKINEFDY